ncbi:MAG TPA: S8 family serine peptidase, partial [Candidatus Methylomirabilis sp.]|nr:S8 family serine peptidase [Candidatus Methylomirabilis sp.]
ESHRLDGTPHILSNSWGLYASSTDPSYAFDPDSPFARAVEQALGEGILVLFSAGNCGGKCPFSNCGGTDTGPGKSILGPNGHPGVMTVGAADLDDEWCGYTSQGPAALPPFAAKPDFCGYTRFDGYFPSADPTVRDFDGGTSAATAVAAGVVALLVQKRPFLTQDEAKAALMETAEDIWAPGFDANSGAGIIRARAAFRAI